MAKQGNPFFPIAKFSIFYVILFWVFFSGVLPSEVIVDNNGYHLNYFGAK